VNNLIIWYLKGNLFLSKKKTLNKIKLSQLYESYTWFLLPALIVFIICMIVPLVIGFYYSTTDWDGVSKTINFVGFQNYINLFKEKKLWNSMIFTLKFVISNVVIQNIFALGFALIVNSKIKGRKFLRTAIFYPCLLSAILVGYLWRKIFTLVLPSLIEIMNLGINPNNVDPLSKPQTVLLGILIINNWQWIGYWMLIYLAGLQSVPEELYEAVSIDGGNIFHKFYYIALPLIAPAITICTVYITVGSFQTYDLILTSTGGGPGHASEILVMYIYNLAFMNRKIGFASANSIVFFVFLLILAIIQLRVLRRREIQL